jgi:hypothetical protein
MLFHLVSFLDYCLYLCLHLYLSCLSVGPWLEIKYCLLYNNVLISEFTWNLTYPWFIIYVSSRISNKFSCFGATLYRQQRLKHINLAKMIIHTVYFEHAQSIEWKTTSMICHLEVSKLDLTFIAARRTGLLYTY